MELFNKKFISQNFWTFFILYIGLAPLLDYYFQLNLFGISFFITLLPYSIMLIKYIVKNQHNSGFLILIFLSLIILTLRSFIYNESFFIALKFSFPYIFLFFIINYLLEKSSWDNLNSNLLERILVLILIIHFVNSILFFLNSSYVIDNPDKSVDTYVEIIGTRFSGIMGGPNVTANFISLIFVFLVLYKRLAIFKFTLYFTFASIAVLPTMSRGAFLIITLVTLFYFLLLLYRNIFNPSILFLSIIFVLIFVLYVYYYILPMFDDFVISLIGRFVDGNFESRSSRVNFFFERINSNSLFYFIGIPWNLQTKSSDFSISDNSFTLVASNFGIVYFLFFLFSYPIRRILLSILNLKRPYLLVYSVILIIVIFNNNSILWTSWVFVAIFGFSYLINAEKKNKRIEY